MNATRSRTFAGWGEPGYFLSIFLRLAQLRRRPFPLRVEGEGTADKRRCLFLTFNNSKFTGGTMMIAPNAEVDDGLIEYVRWGPIGRVGLIRNLSTLYDGTHVNHPLAERRAARRIDFELDNPVDVMVDGEALTLHLREARRAAFCSAGRGIKTFMSQQRRERRQAEEAAARAGSCIPAQGHHRVSHCRGAGRDLLRRLSPARSRAR